MEDVKIPVEILSGRIKPDWADQINESAYEIWQFNDYNAEEFLRDVPVNRFGGLAVWFSKELLLPKDMDVLRTAHSCVDLVLGSEIGLATDTKSLLNAAQQQKAGDDPLIEALTERSRPDSKLGHGGNEKWLFPIQALELEVVTFNPYLQSSDV